MELTTTSRRTSASRHAAGFTLPEVLVGAFIGVLVLAVACLLWGFASRSFAAVLNYVDMANASKIALDTMSQRIRNATNIVTCASNTIVLLDPDGRNIRYAHDARTKTLTETVSSLGVTRTRTLLSECQSFQVSNARGFSTNTSTKPGNIVALNWVCSRRLTGSSTNTEHQVSARILARNQ